MSLDMLQDIVRLFGWGDEAKAVAVYVFEELVTRCLKMRGVGLQEQVECGDMAAERVRKALSEAV